MYIYHLHNYQQIGEEKHYDGVCIRFLLEDIIHAENNNLNWLDLIYGTASRFNERSKIYPSFMTYKKWIELSKNYSNLILSLNFDTHSWKYKSFCKKILEQFPRNKKIIVGAGNEVYEKRGSAEKVYQTALEVHEAMQETQRIYPISFWNETIHTKNSALEKLLNDNRVKNICKYFGFQSLGSSNSKVDKYVKLAKSKGFEGLDIELATLTESFSEIEKKFNKILELKIEHTVIMGSTIHKKLSDPYPIWGKYGHRIIDNQGNIIVRDKYKLIKYVQQYRTKENDMGIKIAKDYRLDDENDRVIDWIQSQLYYAGYLKKPINYGTFDEDTEKAVMSWQEDNEVVVTGIISGYHISVLIEQSIDPITKQLNPDRAFRQLLIYAAQN